MRQFTHPWRLLEVLLLAPLLHPSNWIAHRACFGGACGLYETNADTGERRRLTEGGSDGQPAWSPNGQQIAYISQDDGNFEIYRINADGSGKTRLTNIPRTHPPRSRLITVCQRRIGFSQRR